MANKRIATTELNHDNWNEDHEPEEAGTFMRASTDVLEKRVLKSAKRRLPLRDSTDVSVKNVFGTFTGFKTTPVTSTSPFSFLANVSTTSSTSVVTSATTVNASKSIASNGASKNTENDTNKTEDITKPQTICQGSVQMTPGPVSMRERPRLVDTSTGIIVTKAQTMLSSGSDKPLSTEQGVEKLKNNNSSKYYARLKGLNESVTEWIKSHVDANPFCILTPIFKDYEKYLEAIVSKEEGAKTQDTHTSESKTLRNDNKDNVSSEKKTDSFVFGSANAATKSLSGAEWKPEKSIFSSNVTTSSKSMFGNTEQKVESTKSLFGNTDTTPETRSKTIFGNIDSNISSKGIFGNVSAEKNPFLTKSPVASDDNVDKEQAKSDAKSASSTFPNPTFSFGRNFTSGNATAGFSFGSAKPFTFAAQAVKPQDTEEKTENENKDEEDEEPPKPDFKPVTEEGAIYEQRCKVFVKKDSNFSDRGVGMLFLKPTPNGKTQLIVRAETALGSLLLNTLLTQSIPIKRMNKNTIMLVCLPMPDSLPPPVPVLLRVKTSETADDLLDTLNKHKK